MAALGGAGVNLPRRPSSRRFLDRLIEAQGNICAGCGRKMPPKGDLCLDQDRASIDHVWPRNPESGAPGADSIENMLAMHVRCNGAKGNRPPHGCDLIWHDAVLARLGMNASDNPFVETPQATLASIWPGARA